MTKEKKSPAISRCEAIIQARIWSLQEKIEKVKDRWPEDSCGLRWMEKADKYQQEIDELVEYSEQLKASGTWMNRAKEAEKTISKQKTMIGEAAKKLYEYGEYTFADNLKYRAGLKL